VVEAKDLPAADSGGTSDPFVEVILNGNKHKTKTIKKTLNPTWGETFTFQQNTFNPQADLVRLEVYDWDRIGKNDPLGSAVLHISKHMTAGTVDEWIALEPPHSKPSHIYGSIHVKVVFGDGRVQSHALLPQSQGFQALASSWTGPTYDLLPEEIHHVEGLFAKYDTDKSGTIDQNELKPLLRAVFGNKLNDNLMDRYASAHFQSADKDQSGQIDFGEFLGLYSRMKPIAGGHM